jgi:hypothetical protein
MVLLMMSARSRHLLEDLETGNGKHFQRIGIKPDALLV